MRGTRDPARAFYGRRYWMVGGVLGVFEALIFGFVCRCQYGEDSESPKTCCGGMGSRALSLRWFIAIVALAGVCCVLVGTVLGAVRSNGRAHLTVLLLMIGKDFYMYFY